MLTTTIWLSLLLAPTQLADTSTNNNEQVHIVPPRGVYAEIDTTREMAAIAKLLGDSENEKAATAAELMQNSDRYAPVVFFPLATYLFQQGQADEATFWMYAGRIRTWYDIRRCTDTSVGDALTILNDRLPEILRLAQFEDLEKAKSIVQKAVEWDRKTPYNYDPRWIALHGIRYFTPVPDEGHDSPLTTPEDQWQTLSEELRTEYFQIFEEETNSFTPEMMEQILEKLESLRGNSELTGDENAAGDASEMSDVDDNVVDDEEGGDDEEGAEDEDAEDEDAEDEDAEDEDAEDEDAEEKMPKTKMPKTKMPKTKMPKTKMPKTRATTKATTTRATTKRMPTKRTKKKTNDRSDR